MTTILRWVKGFLRLGIVIAMLVVTCIVLLVVFGPSYLQHKADRRAQLQASDRAVLSVTSVRADVMGFQIAAPSAEWVAAQTVEQRDGSRHNFAVSPDNVTWDEMRYAIVNYNSGVLPTQLVRTVCVTARVERKPPFSATIKDIPCPSGATVISQSNRVVPIVYDPDDLKVPLPTVSSRSS